MSLGNRGLYGSILLLIPLLLAFGSSGVFANSAVEPVKVGEITHFTGTVLVRNSGRWSRVSEVPITLYKTDKVVTKDGRAEIMFIDAGTVRMERDSNVTLDLTSESTGLQYTKTGVGIKVLIGSVDIDINLRPQGMEVFTVRTPDMVAAIRGTTFPVRVNAAGTTRYDLSGDASVQGGQRSDLLSHPLLSLEDMSVPHTQLPRGDRAVAALPIMQTVDRVFTKSQQTDEQFRRFEAMKDAAEHRTTDDDPASLVEQALLARAQANSYLSMTEGYVLDAESSVAEIEWMGRHVVDSVTHYRKGRTSHRDQLLANMGLLFDWLLSPAHAELPTLSIEMELQTAQQALATAREILAIAQERAAKTAELAAAAQACLNSRDECSDEELRILATAAAAQAEAVQAAARAAAAQAIVAMNSYVDADPARYQTAQQAAANSLEHFQLATAAAVRAADAAAAAEAARDDALQLAYLQAVANQAAADANANASLANAIVATLLTHEIAYSTFILTNAHRISIQARRATEASERASAATTPESARGYARSAESHRAQTAERWLQGSLGREPHPGLGLGSTFQDPGPGTQPPPSGGSSTPIDASPIGRME